MKKIFSVFIVLSVLFVFTVPALAGTVNVADNILTSDVMTDLSAMSISGKTFSEADYPYDSDGDFCTLLTMVEYGYSYSRDFSKYNLIFYIYNPSCKLINDDYRNKVQIAIGSGNTSFKYSLSILSQSTDKRFLKACISDISLLPFVQRLSGVSSDRRVYQISGIELISQGLTNAVDYKVAATFTFTGFLSGFGQNGTNTNSLYVNVDNCFTVELRLHSTTWRSDTSSAGQGHKNQISSVYFSIPKSLEKQYSKLTDVKCEWYEDKIGALILDNAALYESIHPISATRYNGNSGVDYTTKPYFYSSQGLTDGYNYGSVGNACGFNYCRGDVAPWNLNSEYARSVLVWNDVISDNFISGNGLTNIIYPYVFYRSSFNSNGLDVSADDALAEVEARGELFYNTVDIGRTQGHNVQTFHYGDGISINSYKSNHNWLNYIADVGFFNSFNYWALHDDSYQVETPIYNLSATDFVGSSSTVANRLFIDENDISALRTYYNNALAKGNSTYLLRFAVTDYYSTDMYIDQQNCPIDCSNVNCYYAEQTFFKDFDIIELTFTDRYGNKVTIPVVSSPINIMGGWQYVPKVSDIADSQNPLARIIAIVLGVLIVTLLVYVVYKIVKVFTNSDRKGRRQRR